MVLLSPNAWWEGLNAFTKVYWLITIPASLIFVIQMALLFFNADSKTETIKVYSAEAGITFKLFNFRNLIGFFTVFGWSGLACIDVGLSNEQIIIISLILGLVMMLSMAVVFFFLKKLMKSVKEGLE
ncbi:MAG: hypothetical protein EHM93_07165 [Bacteroidales bacterium]|nr:MAG: hypothetical protein EHM93_07165 [Bacteroidales bacterium]